MAVICLLSLLVVILSQLPVEISAQSLELLYITPLQDRLANQITIGCYQNTFPVNSPNLAFWVRRQSLAMPNQLQSLVTVQQPQPHQVAFVITQDLEGSYLCSLNNMSSNTLDLVAYPQANITIPLFYIFRSGWSATIDCRVMPGRLSQYYRVSWWNGTFRIATSNPHFVFPGYQLHDNFSLTIDNTQTSDSSTSYQCIVTIDDPQISGTTNRQYDQSELGRITVAVYDQTVSEQCLDTTPLVSVGAVLIVIAIIVVLVVFLVVVPCLCLKYRQYHTTDKLGLGDYNRKVLREQEDKKENNHEMHRQWSTELAMCMTDNTELTCEHIKQQTQLTIELLGLSSVRPDSEEEWNEEIEKERNEQILILLKHIFMRGKRNSSLERDILDTINVEFGSKVISQDDTIEIARHSTAGLPDDIHKYDAVAHSDIPPPFLETCARGIDSPDEREAVWGDHHLCTNPSCPCQLERIRHIDQLRNPLRELEVVDYVDPPNSNVHFMDDIEVLHCDSNGGRYYNSLHDIRVKVPKGAIPEGILVQLEVGVPLFGAFLFPAGMKAVSPILWLCTHPKQFMFNLPIEVELPHCLQLTSLADITSLQLGFVKGDHNSDDKGNIPLRYSGQAMFQPHSSYGTIHIKHFCYLCLTANYTSPQFCSKTLFCLIRVVPRPIYTYTWDINFCVAMFLDTCIKAVKQQYSGSSYDVGIPEIFSFKPPEGSHSDPQNPMCINFEPKNPPGKWMLAEKNTGQLLPSAVVDFEKDIENMIRMHNHKMYPPRFTIAVHGERATDDSRVKVEFTGVDRKLSSEVILQLPIKREQQIIPETPVVRPREIHKQPLTYPTPAAALNSEPDLFDLMDKIAAKIPDLWMDIGIGLGLSVHDLEDLRPPTKCYPRIFTMWKDRMSKPYSWRTIIDVLKSDSVGQKRLAEDLTKERKALAPSFYSDRYTSDGSTPRKSESSDGSCSPQHLETPV